MLSKITPTFVVDAVGHLCELVPSNVLAVSQSSYVLIKFLVDVGKIVSPYLLFTDLILVK